MRQPEIIEGIEKMPKTNTTPTFHWYWTQPDRMREMDGLITLPGGQSSYRVVRIQEKSERVSMTICRVDLPMDADNVRWVSLNTRHWYLYSLPENERRELIPKE
jgi:hypothetical protein